MAEKNPLKGLWLAIVILIVGMSAGFILLSLVYTGPVWVKVLVFVVYIVVVIGVVTSLSRLKDEERKK